MTRDEFNKCVNQLTRSLYNFAFRILRNQEEAEDAVQEVFIRLWNMGDKTNQYKNIAALATTMIKNLCIDQIRKQKHFFKESSDVQEYAHISTDSPVELMERKESDKIIMSIIETMPDQWQDLIRLRYIEGREYEEIAGMTGQNINTLRVNLSRARALIRDEYKKYFDEKRGTGQTIKKVL
jgi:RNA polymerase sigma-70 factor (ECF subfamily)